MYSYNWVDYRYNRTMHFKKSNYHYYLEISYNYIFQTIEFFNNCDCDICEYENADEEIEHLELIRGDIVKICQALDVENLPEYKTNPNKVIDLVVNKFITMRAFL